jgi:hypothetical protein
MHGPLQGQLVISGKQILAIVADLCNISLPSNLVYDTLYNQLAQAFNNKYKLSLGYAIFSMLLDPYTLESLLAFTSSTKLNEWSKTIGYLWHTGQELDDHQAAVKALISDVYDILSHIVPPPEKNPTYSNITLHTICTLPSVTLLQTFYATQPVARRNNGEQMWSYFLEGCQDFGFSEATQVTLKATFQTLPCQYFEKLDLMRHNISFCKQWLLSLERKTIAFIFLKFLNITTVQNDHQQPCNIIWFDFKCAYAYLRQQDANHLANKVVLELAHHQPKPPTETAHAVHWQFLHWLHPSEATKAFADSSWETIGKPQRYPCTSITLDRLQRQKGIRHNTWQAANVLQTQTQTQISIVYYDWQAIEMLYGYGKRYIKQNSLQLLLPQGIQAFDRNLCPKQTIHHAGQVLWLMNASVQKNNRQLRLFKKPSIFNAQLNWSHQPAIIIQNNNLSASYHAIIKAIEIELRLSPSESDPSNDVTLLEKKLYHHMALREATLLDENTLNQELAVFSKQYPTVRCDHLKTLQRFSHLTLTAEAVSGVGLAIQEDTQEHQETRLMTYMTDPKQSLATYGPDDQQKFRNRAKAWMRYVGYCMASYSAWPKNVNTTLDNRRWLHLCLKVPPQQYRQFRELVSPIIQEPSKVRQGKSLYVKFVENFITCLNIIEDWSLLLTEHAEALRVIGQWTSTHSMCVTWFNQLIERQNSAIQTLQSGHSALSNAINFTDLVRHLQIFETFLKQKFSPCHLTHVVQTCILPFSDMYTALAETVRFIEEHLKAGYTMDHAIWLAQQWESATPNDLRQWLDYQDTLLSLPAVPEGASDCVKQWFAVNALTPKNIQVWMSIYPLIQAQHFKITSSAQLTAPSWCSALKPEQHALTTTLVALNHKLQIAWNTNKTQQAILDLLQDWWQQNSTVSFGALNNNSISQLFWPYYQDTASSLKMALQTQNNHDVIQAVIALHAAYLQLSQWAQSITLQPDDSLMIAYILRLLYGENSNSRGYFIGSHQASVTSALMVFSAQEMLNIIHTCLYYQAQDNNCQPVPKV